MTDVGVGQFYDEIANDYDSLRFRNTYLRQVAKFEERYVLDRIREGGSVLEVGPGTGRFTRRLVEKAWHVTGLDISRNMLDVVRQSVSNTNLVLHQLSVYDLPSLPKYGSFDTAVCMRVLAHLADPLGALKIIAGAVKDEGNLIFDLWNLHSFIGLIRVVLRRPSLVYTNFHTYPRMLRMIEGAGLVIEDRVAWGYPRIGSLSLDRVGNQLCKRFGYAVIFNARRQ